MPLRLDIKKKMNARSDRVKSVDFHPSPDLPWVLSAMYSGNLYIWDYKTQALVKQVEVSAPLPVRCAKFIPRKQWIIAGSDDMNLRVYNQNTLEKIKTIEAHGDYIRYIAVHSTLPYVISCSDDMTIKLWDWDKDWACTATYEGHAHYVMMVQWNPKDMNIFASASLDRSIKVWGVTSGSTAPHFSLTGHTRGVNCIEYSPSKDKPYLVSGGDDKTVRVWDYQTRQCLQVLSGHTANISSVLFHPTLPVILSGSEDGTCRIWHATTYRLETTLNYLLERLWSVACLPGTNDVALGFDEGTMVIQLGSEEPVVSMHAGGKIVWARGNEIHTANLRQVDDHVLDTLGDGEMVPLSVKDMGSTEIFPQTISHHPNGRLFAVCGDDEWIVFTAQALRNKAFGSGCEFVWSASGAASGTYYATREASGRITIYKDFVEETSFKPPFPVDEIFGGYLLCVKTSDFICFYEWSSSRLIRRIDVVPTAVIWSDSGDFVVLATEDDGAFVLHYDKDSVVAAIAGGANIDEEGLEIAFEPTYELPNEKVMSGTWCGNDSFVYISSNQKLCCLVAGQTEVIAHTDRPLYVLGYMPEHGKVYCMDRDYNVISFGLSLALIQYESAVVRQDFGAAEQCFAAIPKALHNKVARFLEGQGHVREALEITTDKDHKLDLALNLGDLQMAGEIVGETVNYSKWKQVGDQALKQGDIDLATTCYSQGCDVTGLMLIAQATGDRSLLEKVASMAKEKEMWNVAFSAFLLLGDAERCVDTLVDSNRLPEAVFFARTYCPSKLVNKDSELFESWRKDLTSVNAQLASSLADPRDESYQDKLFAEMSNTLAAERKREGSKAAITAVPADRYTEDKNLLDVDVTVEMSQNEQSLYAKMGWTGSVAPSGLLPETDSSPSEREVVHAPAVDTHVHESSPPAAATADSESVSSPGTDGVLVESDNHQYQESSFHIEVRSELAEFTELKLV
ncbi:COPI protein, putative [Perkinsus marinus ATCC 50983]|uniref:Coatomer subunit beta' n=2 Tax=Perkinsus marinus (strain ATCC 50983 / TXsc) TaxID=423536 RepID=C5K4T2_PERM5|nr:COPI protein, putative [Perkinsus marinus ATCC 50983]EER20354.1 COPI protein, putative [Perkinsus marinus ATCC 50983]|eukprot:XP_002788558.1 COPI protein, putative [Perkinsus marinus ATCC 50983]